VHWDLLRGNGGQLERVVPGQVAGVDVAAVELVLAEDSQQQVSVGDDAQDARFRQCPGEQPRGLRSGRCVRDELGEHRVVVDADLDTGPHSGVDPDTGQLGHIEEQQGSGGRQVALGDVLGVQPGLDCVAGDLRFER
jgi:hypothetical protein